MTDNSLYEDVEINELTKVEAKTDEVDPQSKTRI